jgi:quinol-cytochrome oxidoreductase complex cytochrome b subunit
MPEWDSLGKLLVAIGSIIALLGILFLLADRMGMANPFGWLGKLPGDFSIKRENFHLYFPLGTSILLSVILSLIFYLLSWIFRR